jgi:hypothetical protein
MVRQIGGDALFSLNPIANSCARVADERGTDAERTNVEGRPRHFVANNPRQVTQVHWKKRRRKIARKASLKRSTLVAGPHMWTSIFGS